MSKKHKRAPGRLTKPHRVNGARKCKNCYYLSRIEPVPSDPVHIYLCINSKNEPSLDDFKRNLGKSKYAHNFSKRVFLNGTCNHWQPG